MKYIDVTDADLERLARWNLADPAHRESIKPEFWAHPLDADGKRVAGVKCMTIEDEHGAVFNMRLENCLRVYIQFPPEAEVSKSRVASSLRRMFFYLAGGSKKAGYHEAIFDSKSEHLTRYFKHFGFEAMVNTFRAKL
jgi:hypothetical protein